VGLRQKDIDGRPARFRLFRNEGFDYIVKNKLSCKKQAYKCLVAYSSFGGLAPLCAVNDQAVPAC
jgi:hypothetical protein